jgi:hypothetical protein
MASSHITGYTLSSGRCCHSFIDGMIRSVMAVMVPSEISKPKSYKGLTKIISSLTRNKEQGSRYKVQGTID